MVNIPIFEEVGVGVDAGGGVGVVLGWCGVVFQDHKVIKLSTVIPNMLLNSTH